MTGDGRRPVAIEAIGPGRWPGKFIGREARRMHLHDDVVYRWLRLGTLHQLHSGRSRGLVGYHDCFHRNYLLLKQASVPRTPVGLKNLPGKGGGLAG
jgi:hypothetical protein